MSVMYMFVSVTGSSFSVPDNPSTSLGISSVLFFLAVCILGKIFMVIGISGNCFSVINGQLEKNLPVWELATTYFLISSTKNNDSKKETAGETCNCELKKKKRQRFKAAFQPLATYGFYFDFSNITNIYVIILNVNWLYILF